MQKPRWLKSAAYTLVDHYGYQLVPKEHVERHEFAKHLREVFERIGARTVIDVGANAGQYHDFLRREVRFEGEIHSFEPLNHLCEAMKKRSGSDPKWTIHGLALGRAEGETEINVMNETQFSSMLQPRDSKLHNFATNNTVKYRQPVRVRRLDDVVAEHGSLRDAGSIYLKLDTQGYDLEVLGGAATTLKSVGALQSEASILPIYEGMPDYRTSIATLNELGYDISGMFPIVRDQFLRIVEFDCVMVSRAKLGVDRL